MTWPGLQTEPVTVRTPARVAWLQSLWTSWPALLQMTLWPSVQGALGIDPGGWQWWGKSRDLWWKLNPELSFEDGNNLLLRASPPTACQCVNSLKTEGAFLCIFLSDGSSIASGTQCTS